MWNPKMKPYIFGSSADVHILDLQQSLPLFKHALDVTKFVLCCALTISGIAANKGIILFIDTRPEVC